MRMPWRRPALLDPQQPTIAAPRGTRAQLNSTHLKEWDRWDPCCALLDVFEWRPVRALDGPKFLARVDAWMSVQVADGAVLTVDLSQCRCSHQGDVPAAPAEQALPVLSPGRVTPW